MRKRALIGSAVAIIITILAVALWPGEKEPEYQGKTLSEWLEIERKYPQECAEAVKAIGKHAIPFLLRWIDYDHPSWLRKARAFCAGHLGWLPGLYVKRLTPGEPRDLTSPAVAGFRILGPDAKMAIPELERIARTSTNGVAGRAATTSLSYLGLDAVRPLTGMVLGAGVPIIVRTRAIIVMRNMSYLGTNAIPCVTALTECAGDSNQVIRESAVMSLACLSWPYWRPLTGVKWTSVTPDPALRRCAVGAMVDFATNSSEFVYEVVCRGTNDSDPAVQAGAVRYLAKRKEHLDSLGKHDSRFSGIGEDSDLTWTLDKPIP